MKLKGKKVLITGGSRGIGRCMIGELIKNGVKDIAVIARDKKKLEQLSIDFEEANFLFVNGNVGDIGVLREMSSKIEDRWGRLDVLINNAGIVSAGALEDIPDEEIYDQVAVNLMAVLFLTKYCLPLLKSSRQAAVLNVSSGLGLLGMPFYTVYGSTKAGLRQFSDSLRRELQPFNISVTCVYPTATDTEMMQKFEGREMDSPEYVAEKSIQALMKKELHFIFGGSQRLKDNRLNFESPKKFDKQISESYEQRKEASKSHKAI